MRDIQLILECWGNWSKHRLEMDFSPIAAGFKGLLVESSKNVVMCSDSDGIIIDSCVAKLKKIRPDEYNLIFEYYILNKSKRYLAKKIKKDEKVIRIKIQMAEGFIDGCLSMLQCELDMIQSTKRSNNGKNTT